MDYVQIGILGIIILFIFLFLGMNIAIAMGLAAFIGFALITNVNGAVLRIAQVAYNTAASSSMAVLPLFLLMGELALAGGLADESYRAMHKWVGQLPGGLALATIGGCAGFSAVCGSSIATTTTIGAVALPQMLKYKYDPRLAVGCISAGGTLGILIPPSGAFMIYGIITEQSVGKLFLSGIFPGLLLTVLFMITIIIMAKVNPTIGPRGVATTWHEKLGAFKYVWPTAILFLIVMGGLYLGVFNATEAAAVGAVVALLVALLRNRLNKKSIIHVLTNLSKTTGFLFFILIGGNLFGHFMAASNLTSALSQWVVSLPIPPLGVIGLIMILFLILGCVMDAYSMLLIAVPIVYPVVVGLGFDPIWFAVLVVIMMELGMITPPVGVNVFVMQSVSKLPMYTIFRAVTPFVITMAVCVVILIFFPQIALFLPNNVR